MIQRNIRQLTTLLGTSKRNDKFVKQNQYYEKANRHFVALPADSGER